MGGSGAALASGGFDADAKELAAFREGVVGGVEEEVEFVSAGGDDGGVKAE